MALIMLILKLQSLRMNRTLRIIVIIILALFPSLLHGQNIFRFDHIGSEDGLSQNTGFSILFDSKGFMWVGTYNGLNRYDGYEFKNFIAPLCTSVPSYRGMEWKTSVTGLKK